MIKKIILISILFLTFANTFAEEKNPEITNITYDWNLSNETLVKINWNYFDQCTTIKLWQENIKYKTKTNTEITINYSDINNPSWVIYLTCWTKNINKIYEFPYIENVNLNKTIPYDWNIDIHWYNIWESASVVLEWASFSKNISNTNLIIWKITGDLTWNNLYVTNNWLKSNIINLWILIPKINFIYSDNNFEQNTEITIYWKYLNSYSTTKIKFWDKIIDKYEYNEKDWYLTINIWNDLWDKEIKVYSNWIYSNSMKINVVWNSPVIKSLYNEIEEVEINWILSKKERLYIEWDYIFDNKNNVKIYQNWNNIWFTELFYNKIIIENYTLARWNNLFQVEVNWKLSNILNIENNYTLPYITSIKLWKLNEDNITREVSLSIEWFSEKTDYIYLNWWTTIIKWCYWSICKVNIPSWTLKWNFKVWRWSELNENEFRFDITNENSPYIDYISFSKELKQWTKFTIYWSDFLNSNISWSNLFSIDKDWKNDIKITDNQIEWNLPSNYDLESNSTITIEKYWINTTISFIWKNINWTKINWLPYINKIESEANDKLFKPWTKVKLSWKWFKVWSNVLIWNLKTPLLLENNSASIWNFVIPSWISSWNQTFQIENSQWFKTNSYEILISWINDLPNINLNTERIKNQTFETNIQLSDPKLYSLKVDNKIDEIQVQKIIFQIDNYNKKDDLWTFTLKYNWELIWDSLINNDWKIVFEKKFIIKKQFEETEISLYKKSNFNKAINFNINFYSIEAKNNSTYKEFTNIKNWNIFSSNIIVNSKKWNSCIDSLTDNSNCNEFLTKWLINNNTIIDTKLKENLDTKIEIKTTETQNNDIIQNETNYSSLDKKLEKMYQKIDIFPLKKQLKIFNGLKNELKKLSVNAKNKSQKDLINYIYNSVNLQHKKVIKKYAISK